MRIVFITIENHSLVYAKEGHRIKHLVDRKKDGEGTYDTLFDDMKADLKRTRSTNNIVKYANLKYVSQPGNELAGGGTGHF